MLATEIYYFSYRFQVVVSFSLPEIFSPSGEQISCSYIIVTVEAFWTHAHWLAHSPPRQRKRTAVIEIKETQRNRIVQTTSQDIWTEHQILRKFVEIFFLNFATGYFYFTFLHSYQFPLHATHIHMLFALAFFGNLKYEQSLYMGT